MTKLPSEKKVRNTCYKELNCLKENYFPCVMAQFYRKIYKKYIHYLLPLILYEYTGHFIEVTCYKRKCKIPFWITTYLKPDSQQKNI